MSVIEERAKELGRMIGQSPEYQAVKRAGEALNADPDAVALLQEMERLRGEAQKMIQQGQQPTEELEQQLDGLLEQVQSNQIYQQLIVAQENFDKIMTRVNEWMLDGIRRGAASPIITLS
jgi:cell fate (sporulation/competence/biofilm development) regulator YlbF (YheA/YmcA/DUF963 family)